MLSSIAFGLLFLFLYFILFLAVIFIIQYLIKSIKLKSFKLSIYEAYRPKLVDCIKWRIIDQKRFDKNIFEDYGLTFFCGRQGGGKTTAMVDYLEKIRIKYPKILIYTNFEYKHQTGKLNGWQDLIDIQNDELGVVFAIDELQTEFSSADWDDFPDEYLRNICMQRKQRKKIVATSQVFTRVAKPIREQSFEVRICKTIMKRWTFIKVYDADDYIQYMNITSQENKKKIHTKHRYSFVQSDRFRDLFDTYEVIARMRDKKLIPSKDRLSNLSFTD